MAPIGSTISDQGLAVWLDAAGPRPAADCGTTSVDAEQLKCRLRMGEAEKRRVFDKLFRQESNALYRVVRRLFARHGANGLSAEDLVQEAFARFYAASAHYDGRASPLSYLIKIARNTLIDEVRHQRNGPIVDSPAPATGDSSEIAPEEVQMPGQPSDPTAGVVAARDCLRKAYSELARQHTADTIQAYELRAIHGYDYAELAAMLGAKQGALRQRVSSAIKTLREFVGELP